MQGPLVRPLVLVVITLPRVGVRVKVPTFGEEPLSFGRVSTLESQAISKIVMLLKRALSVRL
jgi:hypothetical protein